MRFLKNAAIFVHDFLPILGCNLQQNCGLHFAIWNCNSLIAIAAFGGAKCRIKGNATLIVWLIFCFRGLCSAFGGRGWGMAVSGVVLSICSSTYCCHLGKIRYSPETVASMVMRSSLSFLSGSFIHPQPPSLPILLSEPGSESKVLTKETWFSLLREWKSYKLQFLPRPGSP